MKQTKIRLSPSEYEMVQDAEVILTKNRIMEKAVTLLSLVQEALLTEASLLHHAYGAVSPKISRGENYEGLPYVVLDYPRCSGSEGIFFIRSMFWWGHFFSSTLQVSGRYRASFLSKIMEGHVQLAGQGYHVYIGADPWQHHFRADNYRPAGNFASGDFETLLQQQVHIKIAARWPLSEWEGAGAHLVRSWKFLGDLIA